LQALPQKTSKAKEEAKLPVVAKVRKNTVLSLSFYIYIGANRGRRIAKAYLPLTVVNKDKKRVKK
jgi:hypothetical protein